MSTRSTITAKFEDGKYRSVYCHFDGYPDGVGKTLVDHYSTQAKIEELISQGGINNLAETIEGSEIYARDLGEKIQIGVGPTWEQARGYRHQYNYLWDGDEWLVNGGSLSIVLGEVHSDQD